MLCLTWSSILLCLTVSMKYNQLYFGCVGAHKFLDFSKILKVQENVLLNLQTFFVKLKYKMCVNCPKSLVLKNATCCCILQVKFLSLECTVIYNGIYRKDIMFF